VSHHWHHILQNSHCSTNSLHQILSCIYNRLYRTAVLLKSWVDMKKVMALLITDIFSMCHNCCYQVSAWTCHLWPTRPCFHGCIELAPQYPTCFDPCLEISFVMITDNKRQQ
jgi:hypothetical protein